MYFYLKNSFRKSTWILLVQCVRCFCFSQREFLWKTLVNVKKSEKNWQQTFRNGRWNFCFWSRLSNWEWILECEIWSARWMGKEDTLYFMYRNPKVNQFKCWVICKHWNILADKQTKHNTYQAGYWNTSSIILVSLLTEVFFFYPVCSHLGLGSVMAIELKLR